MAKNYYEILGVGKDASVDEIKKAFRQKAHRYHPDKDGGDEEKFKEINEAYQVLKDSQKRQQYDQFGSAAFNNGGGGFNWSDFAQRGGANSGFSGMNFDFGDIDLGDIFSSAFGFGGGRNRRRSGPQRGEDVQIKLELEFKEAAFGVTKNLSLRKLDTCERCSGRGAEPGSNVITCKSCNGTGSTVYVQQTPFGNFQTQTKCRDCKGEGKKFEKYCFECQGQGVKQRTKNLEVRIPAGVNEGEKVRIVGEGEAGIKGGASGDLYIYITIKPNKKFVREGYDVISKEKISFPTAVLGGKIDVETIEGLVSLKVPAGTETGTILKLKNKGINRLQGRGKGNHLVQVIIDTPQNPSRKTKKLLEELSEIL